MTPKIALMAPLGPLGASGPGEFISLFAINVVRILLTGVTALDGIGFGLGLVGLALMKSTETPRSRLLALSLALGWLAMCLFQVKHRFFWAQAPLLLPLVAFALHRLRQLATQDRGAHIALVVCTVAVLLSSLVAGVRVGADIVSPPLLDRQSEIAMGHYLSGELEASDRIVTDLPRVAWAAGRQPPPPTIWTAERILQAIGDQPPGFLVLGRKREAYAELRARLAAQYKELELPASVSRATGADRLALFQRR